MSPCEATTTGFWLPTTSHVEDVLGNSIYAMGLRSLARLLGDSPDASEFNQEADKTRDALLEKCWDPRAGAFFDLSGVDELLVEEVTISSLMPLVLEDLPRDIVDRMVDQWVTAPAHFWTPYPCLRCRRRTPSSCRKSPRVHLARSLVDQHQLVSVPRTKTPRL